MVREVKLELAKKFWKDRRWFLEKWNGMKENMKYRYKKNAKSQGKSKNIYHSNRAGC